MFRLKNPRSKPRGSHFFDKQGVIHKEFVSERQAVNSAFYVEVIGRLLKRISLMRPQFRAEGSWFLLHDNAPSHCALVVKIFLAKYCVVEVSHPPYSPDLAQADIFFLR
jgi:histone-lysine N-methyltransferase SETMAR